MDAEKVDVYTLSLIRKLDDGSLHQAKGFGVGANEETLFSVTCIKRGAHLFIRDTSEDHETRDATGLYDARKDVRQIAEEVFERARERWENQVTYRTSV